MGRATLIRIRRGLRAAVASITDALDGEIFGATDTNELFLGESDGTADPVQVDYENLLNVPAELDPEALTAALAAKQPSLARGDVSGTTASLADDATGNLSLEVGKSAIPLSVTTSAAAWVRIYSTDAARTADAARLITSDPDGEVGLIGEGETTSDHLTMDVIEKVIGANLDTPVAATWYLAVTNLSGGTTTITVTVNRILLEG